MSDIAEIEVTIEELQKVVDRRNQLRKLESNREFRKIVLDGYFKDEAARLAAISADPAHEKMRPQILMEIQAISCFRQFLRNIDLIGGIAERELKENHEALEEIRSYEGEDV